MSLPLQYLPGGQHAVAGPCFTGRLPLPAFGPLRLDAPEARARRHAWLTRHHLPPGDMDFLRAWLIAGHPVDPAQPAHWVAALTMALQAMTLELPGRAQVLEASPQEALFVLPCQRPRVMADALRWAVRLVSLWCRAAPPATAPARAQDTPPLQTALDTWLRQSRGQGLPAHLCQLAHAAMTRQVPFHLVDAQTLQLGWGSAQVRVSAREASEALSGMVQATQDTQPRFRIPVAAITGTNGKTTVARMLHHIWLTAGVHAGVCTTEGLWLGLQTRSRTNLSGLPGAYKLLAHPRTEAAVLEMPRKGLIQFGHPCDHYDVAALLNVQDDHIGEMGVNTLQDMAELKASVLARARHAVVINADDPLCLAMQARARCRRRIWVTLQPALPGLQRHLAQGGEAVIGMPLGTAQRRWIVLAHGPHRTPVMPLDEVPATAGGLLHFNVFNALAATALAWALGIEAQTVWSALSDFGHGVDQNPGRLNLFDGHGVRVLLDYAHNPIGVQGLCGVIERLPVRGQRRLVCLGVGNRHAAHIDACAPLLARHFDQVVLGQDPHFVRKSRDYTGPDPCGAMLDHFVQCMRAAGLPAAQMQVERDGARAIQLGIDQARPGDLLVLMAEERLAAPLLRAAGFTALRSLTRTADADPVARSA
jgi:UDP-N-acetylmuramyl tripeptide synthase